MKYEVALIREDGTLCRGGIPTSKSHAQKWANENSRMYPDEKFIVVEYEAQQEPAEIDVSENIPDEIMKQYPVEKIGETEGIVIEPKDIPEREIDKDFDI